MKLFKKIIVILIIINFYLVANRKSVSLFREAAGMFNKIKYAMFLGASINILLSVILGKLFGLAGVFLGTIISTLTTYYWYEAKLLFKDKFSVSMTVFFKNQGISLLYVCVSIILTSLAVSWISGGTVGGVIIKLCICLVVPNVLYFLLLRKKPSFQVVMNLGAKYYKNIRKR